MGKNSKKNKRPNQKSRLKKLVYMPERRGDLAVFPVSKDEYRTSADGWRRVTKEK